MAHTKSKYDLRGVSASKSEVHDAIKHLDKGLFPMAFCKVLPDLVGGDDQYCNIMHADTAGTKTSLAYIYWKETGDLSVWSGIAQDAIVMNIDDMACVGAYNNIVISSTIGRNKPNIPGEVIKEIINGTNNLLDNLNDHGLNLKLAGGETADVGDIVRTVDVGITAFARLRQDEVIENNVEGGQVIVGIASYGQSNYETDYNGGMGSNGLTSARHDVLSSVYRSKYPESYDAATPEELCYAGSKLLSDTIEIAGRESIPVGKLILSPTRTYIPLLAAAIEQYKSKISGIIHCTGGAQTKVMKFVQKVRIVKDSLLPIPPLFQLIENESKTPRQEMYEVFNMGHRMEIYTDQNTADELVSLSQSFGIDAQIIGHVENADRNELIIKDDKGTYSY